MENKPRIKPHLSVITFHNKLNLSISFCSDMNKINLPFEWDWEGNYQERTWKF